MNGENEERQVQQYCPSLGDVVTLIVDGKVQGWLIKGVVKECYTWKRCTVFNRAKFCWVNHEILTALS